LKKVEDKMVVKTATSLFTNQAYINISRNNYLALIHYLNGFKDIKITSQKETMVYEINGSEMIFTDINKDKVKGLLPKRVAFLQDAKEDKQFKDQIKLILKQNLK